MSQEATIGKDTMIFGTFKKSVLAEEIVERLLSLIKEKELRPGDKLPPERELASMMQISRPSLREALRAMAIMNIVDIRQGDGTYITSLAPELLVEHLDFVFTLSDSTFLTLFEARKILEVGLVTLAAQHITDEELAELDRLSAKSMEVIHDQEAFLQVDIELHEVVINAARNPILHQFMASLKRLGRASRSRTVAIIGTPAQSVEDHRAIIQALYAHDPERAASAMLRHLNNVETQLKLAKEAKEPPGTKDEVVTDSGV